jgi:predicted dehydrogenase
MGDVTVVALIGYGYWGPNLLRNFAECPGAEVKWVADRNAAQLARARTRWPSILVTTDLEDVLRDPEVDAIVVATPIGTHHDVALRGLLAGKHVFVEKPLAASSRDAEELVRVAEKTGRTLMVGHTFEYSPPVMKIKELLDSGELGDIYFICASRVNLGLHQKDVSVIWDLAPHDFSILFYWLGETPDHVRAFGRSCLQPWSPDVAFVNLAFPSGTVAEVQLSWLSPVKLRRTMIVGSRKMLLYDDTESVEKVKIFDHGVTMREPGSYGEFQLSYRTGDILAPRLDNTEPLMAEASHFVECVRTGARPRTDGRSGLRVVRALERAEASLLATRTERVRPAASSWEHAPQGTVTTLAPEPTVAVAEPAAVLEPAVVGSGPSAVDGSIG